MLIAMMIIMMMKKQIIWDFMVSMKLMPWHYHYTCKYKGATYNICNLKYNTPKKTLLVSQNMSNYVYHLSMNQLEKEKNGMTIKCKTIFIEKVRFIASSHSRLTDNLAEGLHKDKWKDCQNSKHEHWWEKVWRNVIKEIWRYMPVLWWIH